MNKLKFILTLAMVMLAMNLSSQAGTIGYADFQKVISEYTFAKNAYKDIDNKLLELQQYVIDKDKQFKNIESPIQKKTFEDQIQKEYKAKEERVYNLKVQKETQNQLLSIYKSLKSLANCFFTACSKSGILIIIYLFCSKLAIRFEILLYNGFDTLVNGKRKLFEIIPFISIAAFTPAGFPSSNKAFMIGNNP